MRRYLDYAIYWDFLIVIFIGTFLIFSYPIFGGFIKTPTIENMNNFWVSLITLSATLIGFLLTIITVIVTFKKGFEDKIDEANDPKHGIEIPVETIFEKKISKETKFYGTPIHKRVVDVFVNATFEIGFVLIVLLIIQFNIFSFSILWISVISSCVFILIILSILRSLYIFKLFLRVHMPQKSDSK
jgi:hypothetical protein